jgi:hypothetical protein
MPFDAIGADGIPILVKAPTDCRWTALTAGGPEQTICCTIQRRLKDNGIDMTLENYVNPCIGTKGNNAKDTDSIFPDDW